MRDLAVGLQSAICGEDLGRKCGRLRDVAVELLSIDFERTKKSRWPTHCQQPSGKTIIGQKTAEFVEIMTIVGPAGPNPAMSRLLYAPRE